MVPFSWFVKAGGAGQKAIYGERFNLPRKEKTAGNTQQSQKHMDGIKNETVQHGKIDSVSSILLAKVSGKTYSVYCGYCSEGDVTDNTVEFKEYPI